MFHLREYREPTSRLPDFLPWAALVAPGVVLQKNAVLQKTVAFRGPDLAASSDAELATAIARLNNALKRLGSGWALYVEAQRFTSDTYPTSRWRHPAAWVVDVERREGFRAAGAHCESSYFLTFVWQLPASGEKRLEALFFDDPERADEGAQNRRDLAHFQKTVGELVGILRGVFPDVGELDDSQTLSYLHSTVSTNRHPVRAPETPMYLDALLPDMAFTAGDVPMLGRHFIPTCTVTGFPGTSLPGILDALNHLQLEYRWVTRFICLDKADAKRELEAFRKGWWQKRKSLWTLLKEEAAQAESALTDSAAANQAADADAALQELGEDVVSFGYLTTTFTVWDESLEAARRKAQLVKQVVQSRGFTVRDETLNCREAWLGSLPGHVYANVRRPLVSSLNLAHLMPVSAVWAGDEESAHLKEVTGVGAPHVYCSTGTTPFRLHLAVGDVGHTFIGGPTGAGKSTLLALLALQWLKYPGAQVILFDKGRSARAATLAVGGACYEPGNPRAPVAFQPLAGISDKVEREWASRFVLTLLSAQKVPETPTLKAWVDQAVEALAGQPLEHRTLTVLAQLLGSYQGTLREALRPYTLEGNYGQIFDADKDALKGAAWMMVEMGHLMALGEEAVIPALEYLFHRVEGRFDGRATLMVLDEAWLFLGHPVFAGRLRAWLKTLRKKNVYVVFATQEIADAMGRRELLSTILSACPTKVFLPDEEALSPAMAALYRDFGLSDTEVRLLARAQKKRDYYYRSVRGRRLFQLGLGPVGLAFAAMSSEADQHFLDGLAERLPAGPLCAEAILRHRGLEWAADLVRSAAQADELHS